MGDSSIFACFSTHWDAILATQYSQPDFEGTLTCCFTTFWWLKKLVRNNEILLRIFTLTSLISTVPLLPGFLEGMDLKMLKMLQGRGLRNACLLLLVLSSEEA